MLAVHSAILCVGCSQSALGSRNPAGTMRAPDPPAVRRRLGSHRRLGPWLLGCWAARLLGCWAAGLLGCWAAGLLGCWAAGLLGCWAAGLLSAPGAGTLSAVHQPSHASGRVQSGCVACTAPAPIKLRTGTGKQL